MRTALDNGLATIVHVTREYGDLVGVGGIKDSVEGLCVATAKYGIATHVFLPFQSNSEAIKHLIPCTEQVLTFAVSMQFQTHAPRNEEVKVISYLAPDRPRLTFHFVQARRFAYLCEGDGRIERRGVYTYTTAEANALGRPEIVGDAYADFFEMDILFIKATLRALEYLDLRPDLIRCHEGHTAALPLIAQYSNDAFASYLTHTPTLTTIHNASDWYRGEIPYSDFVPTLCNIPAHILTPCVHNDKFEPLLAAGLFGTALHTVSENYAREIQHTGLDHYNSWLGHKLASYGIIIRGITHGIDVEKFSPKFAQHRGIPAAFSPLDNDFAGKAICKQELLRDLNCQQADADTPLLTFVSRFVYQKGIVILARAIQLIFEEDPDVVLVGNGSGYYKTIEELRKVFGTRFSSRIHINYTYDARLSNTILAAGDFCIIPSLFEPCGQIDLIAQLNGNIPIVHAVGGLVKVEHKVTGFAYQGWAGELAAVIRQALQIYRHDKPFLRNMQVHASQHVATHFTWERVFTHKYLPLYQQVILQSRPSLP